MSVLWWLKVGALVSYRLTFDFQIQIYHLSLHSEENNNNAVKNYDRYLKLSRDGEGLWEELGPAEGSPILCVIGRILCLPSGRTLCLLPSSMAITAPLLNFLFPSVKGDFSFFLALFLPVVTFFFPE